MRNPLYIVEMSFDKGSSKNSVSQTRAPRELELFALCSESQNMTFYSARRKWLFFANFAVIFWQKKFKHDMENF